MGVTGLRVVNGLAQAACRECDLPVCRRCAGNDGGRSSGETFTANHGAHRRVCFEGNERRSLDNGADARNQRRSAGPKAGLLFLDHPRSTRCGDVAAAASPHCFSDSLIACGRTRMRAAAVGTAPYS